MSFYGKTDEPAKAAPELRTYSYKDFYRRKRTVLADYVNFTQDHVSFWTNRTEGQDSLVLCLTNANVRELTQLREES